jgi:membrane protein
VKASIQFARQLLRFARRVGERFSGDRCTRAAAALSFTTMFALVPFMAVGFAMFSLFPQFQRLRETIKDFIYSNFVPAAGDVVEKYIDQFIANAARLTTWGLLFVLATAFMLMLTIEQTFNDIWHAREHRKRLHRLLAYWALLTLGPMLIGVSLTLTSQLATLSLLAPSTMFGDVRPLLFGLLPAVLEVLAFVLLYTVIPSRPVRMRHALVGSLCAVTLFEIAKRGFALYVSLFPSYRVIYGAVATLPVFLLWVYLSWLVVLLGAVVTATLPEWRSLRPPLKGSKS